MGSFFLTGAPEPAKKEQEALEIPARDEFIRKNIEVSPFYRKYTAAQRQ